MPPISPEKTGLRKVKSNLKKFLARLAVEDDSPDLGNAAIDDEAPSNEPSADSDIFPEQVDHDADLNILQDWREWLKDAWSERERRRSRDVLRKDKAQRHIEDLLQAFNRQEEERKEFATREDQIVEIEEPAPNPDSAHPEPFPTEEGFSSEDLRVYRAPEVDFLVPSSFADSDFIDEEILEGQKEKLQETFDSFAVDAFVCDALVGPRVTQFRVKPGYGVKVSAIAHLEKNISLAMAVNAVRIQAPIPGEPFVGVEVPNPKSLTIRLRHALETKTWKETNADIPLIMGMDMTGQIVLTDLARAPHMLIAGATGSGKSVCINNFILSLLYRFRPDELEMVLIDPKQVEFALYKEIPHLIHPVVSDPKLACGAIKWLVKEMERRYALMAEKKVRNISGYNVKAMQEGYAKLPYTVLIIDEMADLMMTSRQEVETPIARLAQMSRAVGIHTILATQRPSVNVITGVIKANYPSRAAFMVTSVVDSRTILDSKGAESLQGRGDMLFNPPGVSRLQRLQSPFVDDEEILRVTDYLRGQIEPRYRVSFAEMAEATGPDQTDQDEEMDPLLPQCIEIIATSGKASTSFLQRKLKIGYNRAASLMEELEVRGYVGPQIGQNPREILIDPSELNA